MKFLIVLGDSLNFPRPNDDYSPNLPEETYFDKVVQGGFADGYWLMASGGSTVSDTLKRARNVAAYIDDSGQGSFTIIVTQGIVDSSPRPYPRQLSGLFFIIASILRKFEINWRHERSRALLRLWGRPWTTPAKFEALALQLVDVFRELDARILWVRIQEPTSRLKEILGKFSVIRWNERLYRIQSLYPEHFTVIDFHAQLHPDGQHLTREDHSSLAKILMEEHL